MTRKYVVVLLALFSIVALCFSGCSGERGELKIGSILPLSGSIKNYGELVKNGMDLAVEEINAGEGVDGSNLKIVYKDSEGKPETATKVIYDLINQEKVPAIIGAVSSTVTLSIAPIADNSNIVLLSPVSSSPKLSGISQYFFRIYPSDTLEGYSMAQTILNYELKEGVQYYNDVIVVAAQTDYAEGVKIEFVKEFRRKKGKTLDVINYDPNDPKFNEVVGRIMTHIRDSATAIFIAGYYKDIADFLMELRNHRRFDPQAVKVFACAGAYTPEFRKLAAPYFEPRGIERFGLVFPVISHITPDTPDEKISGFAKRYHKKYGSYPETYAAHGYDSVMLLADVIEKRGTMPRDIQFGLTLIKDWYGVAGKVTFDDRHDVSKFPIPYGYDGKELYLFTPDYKEKRPEYYDVEVWTKR